MKNLGYGKGYKYAHESTKEEIADQERMPKELKGKKYYSPSDVGFESEIKRRIRKFK